MNSIEYVAFLRGINVGGNQLINMIKLRSLFESLGYTDVRTILATGNIVFRTSEGNLQTIRQDIVLLIQQNYTYTVHVTVYLSTEIDALVRSKPFKNIYITPLTRLYVTFIDGETDIHKEIAYESPEKDFTIMHFTDHILCSVMLLSPNRGTVQLMNFIERKYGKNITTRNWNSILRIQKAFNNR